MSRRGQCRCGKILDFARTAQGYKVRCPACKAVVRLRADTPPPLPSRGFATEPDLPTDLVVKPFVPANTGPPDLSVLSLHESSAPIAQVELEVYREPERKAGSGRLWLLLGLAFVGVLVAAGSAVLILG